MLCRNNIQASLQSQDTAGCTSNGAQAQRNGNHTDLTFAHRNGKPADWRSKCNRDCMVSGKLRHLARHAPALLPRLSGTVTIPTLPSPTGTANLPIGGANAIGIAWSRANFVIWLDVARYRF